MSNHSLVVSYDAEVPEDFFEDFLRDAKSANVPVETSTRTVGPIMALEWLLPTTVIVFLANSSGDTITVPGTPYLSLGCRHIQEEAPGMVRIARVVAPGFPHRITQRENRRQDTFSAAFRGHNTYFPAR